MKNLIKKNTNIYYEENEFVLLKGDCFEQLKRIKSGSIDMIFADPPYFLSGGGITCQNGTMVCVDKGDWDKANSLQDIHNFNRKWIRMCKRVLKDNGTIWISGTYHNIYSVGYALQQEGFKIINNITWQKTNPPPNLACRCFTHSSETILWAKKHSKKAKHIFNYALMKEENGGKQMKDIWVGTLTPPKEKKNGKHPTQKPKYLLERIIKSSTNIGDVVLDPFQGSGTSGVVAKELGRKYIGIEIEEDYLELTKRRMGDVANEKF